jgi:glycosyltransferase involved in cell wall biosynthesis
LTNPEAGESVKRRPHIPRSILVATGDVLAPKMAGPAIRAWQIATELAKEHRVTLVSNLRCDLSSSSFDVRFVDDREMTRLVERSEVIVMQGNLMAQHAALQSTDRIVVVDIYDPFHLEVLEQSRDMEPMERRFATRSSKEVINEQLMRGDFFVCASDKQRDFWLGQLAAVGRINPATYDERTNLRALIDVVPFGVDDQPPRHATQRIKGVMPGIGSDDLVLLWGGGIYNWFDPLTLLRAVHRLIRRLPTVRLVFLGVKHPNPNVGEMRMAVEARSLTRELGLDDVHVFFNEDWVPYDDRQDYLLEADVGVSTHFDQVETAFSFRTRILDYLWAGLPIVATAGDSLAELIESAGAGVAVAAGDVEGLEAALFRLLTDESLRRSSASHSRSLSDEFRWSQTLMPLVEFCRAPRRAPDLVEPLWTPSVWDPVEWHSRRHTSARILGLVVDHLRRRDYRGLEQRIRRRLVRLLPGKSRGQV